MARGQSTVEWVGAMLAVALVVAGVALVVARTGAFAPLLERLVPRTPHRTRLTPDERALRNPRLRALVDAAVPALVLERDRHGEDDTVPVDVSCRRRACARLGVAVPTLYVHVVHRRSGPAVELWAYYPDSQTTHLPLAALRGSHADDWEGLLVSFDRRGRQLGARATAHAG